MTQLLETRKLIMAGHMPLWLDFRAGHCLNLSGVPTSACDDGAVVGDYGRFRTGVGFGTAPDWAATPMSSGYVSVADSPLFYTGAVDGFCLIASYTPSWSSGIGEQIMGQYGDAATGSWVLRRTGTKINFITTDGAAAVTHQYGLNVVPSEIETVAVRVDSSFDATTYVFAPAVSTSGTTNVSVPQDSDLSCTIGANDAGENPFFGALRYVAFIRGSQTAAILAAVVAELEDFQWETGVAATDRHGGAADRRVHYSSRFGCDVSVNEDTGIGTQVSNSDWCHSRNGIVPAWENTVEARHFRSNPRWALEDIDKVLYFYEEQPV